jgi:hypothetical protein
MASSGMLTSKLFGMRGSHDIDRFVRDIASAPAVVSLVHKLSR